MIIGLLRVDLLIPGCNSLKEKRSILKKHLHRIRRTYNVAVAETDQNDKWRRAELSFITVNALKDTVERTLRKVVRELETAQDTQVLAEKMEIL
jgi:uncharacterized protein YlxP (DUF503 family)